MTFKTTKIALFLLILLSLSPAIAAPRDDGAAAGLVARLQSSFLSKDSPAYANLFSPALREREADFQRTLVDKFSLNRASFFLMNESVATQPPSRVFLRVILENDYLAVLESWDLLMEEAGPNGLITAKSVRDDPGLLYKIKMPSPHVEFIPLVEIHQADISLTFTNAYVFFDNIPDIETALLVLGEGLVSYHPSDPKERHQLELAYRTQKIQERIEYAFCRFSNAFFQENVRLAKTGETQPASFPESLRARAAALLTTFSSSRTFPGQP